MNFKKHLKGDALSKRFILTSWPSVLGFPLCHWQTVTPGGWSRSWRSPGRGWRSSGPQPSAGHLQGLFEGGTSVSLGAGDRQMKKTTRVQWTAECLPPPPAGRFRSSSSDCHWSKLSEGLKSFESGGLGSSTLRVDPLDQRPQTSEEPAVITLNNPSWPGCAPNTLNLSHFLDQPKVSPGSLFSRLFGTRKSRHRRIKKSLPVTFSTDKSWRRQTIYPGQRSAQEDLKKTLTA